MPSFALGAAVGWLAGQFGAHLIRNLMSRRGAVGYRTRACGFLHVVATIDGRQIEALYNPRDYDAERFDLVCRGDIFNDTDTQLLLSGPKVYFEHPLETRMIYNTPTVRVDGTEPAVISVPPHRTTSIEIVVTIQSDQLERFYADTIPVLHLAEVTGKERVFRLGETSFLARGWWYGCQEANVLCTRCGHARSLLGDDSARRSTIENQTEMFLSLPASAAAALA